MSLDQIHALLSSVPGDWTAAKEQAVTQAVRALLATTRTVRVTVLCTDRVAAGYWQEIVKPRLMMRNADLIHTSGAHWDGLHVSWSWSTWPRAGDADFESFHAYQAGRMRATPPEPPTEALPPMQGERLLEPF